MKKRPQLRRTYIRQWRERAGLSLRALANRMEEEPGGDLIISHVSIGRIERGEQIYTQPVIEAIAEALGVSVAALLEVNPEIEDSRVIDITSRLRLATPAEREQAIRVLDAVLPRSHAS
jgi:transcriptional regulator with XRE-family HTH domain